MDLDPSRALAVAVVASLLLALVAAQPAGAQYEAPQLRGVQLHPLWDGVDASESDRMLRLAQRAGADVVRIDLSWASLELNGRGRINWHYVRRADRFMRDARRRGQAVIVSFWGTPCWASRAPAELRQGCRGAWWERRVQAYPPRRAQDFARAAAWVAQRWQREVVALEIWNEPNHPFFLRGPDPVRWYSRMVRASYRPLRRAAPRVQVLAGALSYADASFLAELYDRGRIDGHYDGVSYHPYTDGRDPLTAPPAGREHASFVEGTARLRELMAARGETADLWITEVGSSTCQGSATCVDEATQARHVRDFVDTAKGWPFVRAVVVYSLRDNRTPATVPSGRFGLLRHDLRPKPAWNAFRAALER